MESISDLNRLCEFKTDAKNNLSLESECNQLKEIGGKYGLNTDLSYAEEGIGTFLKGVWDTIVSIISKIIDWFANLFGGGSSGGGGGGGSPSEKVDKNLKKAEEVVRKTEKSSSKNTSHAKPSAGKNSDSDWKPRAERSKEDLLKEKDITIRGLSRFRDYLREHDNDPHKSFNLSINRLEALVKEIKPLLSLVKTIPFNYENYLKESDIYTQHGKLESFRGGEFAYSKNLQVAAVVFEALSRIKDSKLENVTNGKKIVFYLPDVFGWCQLTCINENKNPVSRLEFKKLRADPKNDDIYKIGEVIYKHLPDLHNGNGISPMRLTIIDRIRTIQENQNEINDATKYTLPLLKDCQKELEKMSDKAKIDETFTGQYIAARVRQNLNILVSILHIVAIIQEQNLMMSSILGPLVHLLEDRHEIELALAKH
jgi:hypothetical protein